MCISSWWYLPNHENLKFVLVFNRDEALDRITLPAQKWKQNKKGPIFISGLDAQNSIEGVLDGNDTIKYYSKTGTWLAVSSNGRIGILTNIPQENKDFVGSPLPLHSRGELIINYLTSDKNIDQYMDEIIPNLTHYNGFNLVLGNLKNKEMKVLSHVPNIKYNLHNLDDRLAYALSNVPFGDTMIKTDELLNKFQNTLAKAQSIDNTILELITIMGPNDKMESPKNKKDLSKYIFVKRVPIFPSNPKSPLYGTRTTTIITFDKDNCLRFEEYMWSNENQNLKIISQTKIGDLIIS